MAVLEKFAVEVKLHRWHGSSNAGEEAPWDATATSRTMEDEAKRAAANRGSGQPQYHIHRAVLTDLGPGAN